MVRKAEERFCTNCREPLPVDAAECPACGVYSGDLFDGKTPKKPRRRMWPWLPLVALLLAAGAAAWIWFRTETPIPYVRSAPPRLDTGPTHVIRDRPGTTRRGPGAKITEAEAVRIVRNMLIAQTPQLTSECLAMMSHGYQKGGYVMSAFNRCDGTRLGKWRVDGKTGAAARP
jgi:hypothetical protein